MTQKTNAIEKANHLLNWETEVFVIHGENRTLLVQQVQHLLQYLSTDVQVNPGYLAYTLNTQLSNSKYRLAIVASSTDELQQKLQYALQRLEDNQCKQIKELRGIYYFEENYFKNGKLAFLFSGEGSQYINMLSDLCIYFPEVRECFDMADRAYLKYGDAKGDLPSHVIFPPPFFSKEERLEAEKKLWEMDNATEAILTTDIALYTLLNQLGIKADIMAGHSAGEWSAMAASGIIDSLEFIDNLHRLNSIYRDIQNDPNIPEASLAAVGADANLVSAIIEKVDGDIYIADDNCPHQVVIAGEEKALNQVLQLLRDRNVFFEKLPFNRGYHTPMFTYILEPLSEYFSSLTISPPETEIYSVSTASPYPQAPDEIRELAVSTWVRPVKFSETIEAMYKAGARIFVEVGPKGKLTGFVDDILRGQPHLAVASNVARRSGITQLNHLVGMLAAIGIPVNFEYLYERRNLQKLTLQASDDALEDKKNSALIELVLGFPEINVSSTDRQSTQESKTKTEEVREKTRQDSSQGKIESEANISLLNKQINKEQESLSMPESKIREVSSRSSKRVNTTDSRTKPMQQYLKTMENFLKVQQEVMLAYFTENGIPQIDAPREETQMSEIISEDEEESELIPIEEPSSESLADSAVISDAQPQESDTSTPEAPEESVSSEEFEEVTKEALTQKILNLVSEKTGYPQDMLDLNLDMEADLGIDSIKRVEILGAFQEKYASEPENEVDMEKVASLKTLQQVIDFLFNLTEDENGRENIKAEKVEVTGSVEKHQETRDIVETNTEYNRSEVTENLSNSLEETEERYPFIGSVTYHEQNQKLVAVRYIDLDDDIFMFDHVFGRDISDTDSELKPLPIIPLTVSVEIMAEAAARLMSEKQLIGMKNIQANRWIQVEESESPVALEITAIAVNNSEVKVQIQYLAEKEESSQKPSTLIKGEAIFGDSFPDSPIAEDLPLSGSRKPKVNAEELYSQHWMFHGPSFQGVASLDRIGDDGIDAYLEVLPTDTLFRNISNPSFIFDPFLLDAAGQLVGYWPLEHFESGFIIFPIRIQELYLYGHSLSPSEQVKCQMRIRQATQRQVQADMDIIKEDGQVCMRVIGWTDWRFYWPVEFHYFWRFPNKGMISVPVSLPHIEDASVECCRMGVFGEVSTTIWENVWVHLILNHQEREIYRSMKNRKRRTEWLFGRTAAKDAVRLWLKKRYQKNIYPADIYINQNENGCPIAEGECIDEIGIVPSVSIAHTDELAFAIAGSENQQLGIDVERISERNERFENLAFNKNEQNLLEKLNDKPEWITRFWCAKEAVSKALGCGFKEGTQSLIIRDVNRELGVLTVKLSEKLADVFPEFTKTEIQAYTIKDEDYIVAFALMNKQ